MIKVKIDTKEIFHVISIEETNLTANMAEDLMELVAKKQEEENKSLVINFLGVESVDDSIAASLQQLHENTVRRYSIHHLPRESLQDVDNNLPAHVAKPSQWGNRRLVVPKVELPPETLASLTFDFQVFLGFRRVELSLRNESRGCSLWSHLR